MTATVTPIKQRVPASMTSDPLRLYPETLHRVDTIQLPAGTGVSLGACRTDMGVCMGHPECPDRTCQGHPDNQVQEDERDARLTRIVWCVYGAIMAVGLVLALQSFVR